MAMSVDRKERLRAEIALLTASALEEEEFVFDEHTQELRYTASQSSMILRIPDGYLLDELPFIVTASCGKTDMRDSMSRHLSCLGSGEEILDMVFPAFYDMGLKTLEYEEGDAEIEAIEAERGEAKSRPKTIIVWLHHLLNTNKRKQASSPASSKVAGVTKPGYPGVLIFSGPAADVHSHVDDLKSLPWQAFQIRLESDDEWAFAHGSGVKEVEAMKDVVAELGVQKRELFMQAMRMK